MDGTQRRCSEYGVYYLLETNMSIPFYYLFLRGKGGFHHTVQHHSDCGLRQRSLRLVSFRTAPREHLYVRDLSQPGCIIFLRPNQDYQYGDSSAMVVASRTSKHRSGKKPHQRQRRREARRTETMASTTTAASPKTMGAAAKRTPDVTTGRCFEPTHAAKARTQHHRAKRPRPTRPQRPTRHRARRLPEP